MHYERTFSRTRFSGDFYVAGGGRAKRQPLVFIIEERDSGLSLIKHRARRNSNRGRTLSFNLPTVEINIHRSEILGEKGNTFFTLILRGRRRFTVVGTLTGHSPGTGKNERC